MQYQAVLVLGAICVENNEFFISAAKLLISILFRFSSVSNRKPANKRDIKSAYELEIPIEHFHITETVGFAPANEAF